MLLPHLPLCLCLLLLLGQSPTLPLFLGLHLLKASLSINNLQGASPVLLFLLHFPQVLLLARFEGILLSLLHLDMVVVDSLVRPSDVLRVRLVVAGVGCGLRSVPCLCGDGFAGPCLWDMLHWSHIYRFGLGHVVHRPCFYHWLWRRLLGEVVLFHRKWGGSWVLSDRLEATRRSLCVSSLLLSLLSPQFFTLSCAFGKSEFSFLVGELIFELLVKFVLVVPV